MPDSRRCAPSRSGSSSRTGQRPIPAKPGGPEVAERLQGPLAEEEQRVPLGKGAEHVFLLPGLALPRSVVSSNPATCAAVISVLISFTTSAASAAAVPQA